MLKKYSNKDKDKEKWINMLYWMLQDYKSKHPKDKRTNEELLESLMGHFFIKGLVDKDLNGKYNTKINRIKILFGKKEKIKCR